MIDEVMMDQALVLAARGRGATSPNPMVGAVVTHGNRVVGRGFHVRAARMLKSLRSTRPVAQPRVPRCIAPLSRAVTRVVRGRVLSGSYVPAWRTWWSGSRIPTRV